MKIFKVVVVLSALLLGVLPAWAQFTIIMTETSQVLTTTCDGPTPIPDGTQVQIIWDRGATGVSPEDTLAPLCSDPPLCASATPPGTVTINNFVMNGGAVGFEPGNFYMETSLGSVGTVINPNAFYLLICMPTAHWVSNTIQNIDGYSEVEMGPWTCIASPCAGCPPPPPAITFTAADNATCQGVGLTWTYADTVANLDRFYISRDGVRIDSTGPLVRAYTDSTAVPSVTYTYGIIARRHCLDGSNGFSTPLTDMGSRHASPPIPGTVTATSTTCDSVRVAWTYTTNAGIDSFIIKRDGVRVGAIAVVGSAGPRFWYHATADRGVHAYSVVGRNPVCGEGTPSVSVSGEAQQEPLAVTNVAATDGVCDSTVVTWTDGDSETSYHVYRSAADGGGPIDLTPSGLAANTVRYRDANPTVGTNYRYWVVAINGCGTSQASAYDLGMRVTTPTAPPTFQASDSTFCTHTAMTWSDITTETGYQILRNLGVNTDTIATLPANTTSYNDSLGSPGTVYNYSVRATNACGAAISIPNPGAKAAVPAQIVGLTATDGTLCGGVTLSWTNVTSEQGYRVYRDSALIGTTNPNVTTYTDDTALPGVHYGYAVLGYNTCGNGLGSVVDSGFARMLPEQVTGLVASDTSCSVIHLTWTDVASDTAYQVFRDGLLIGSTAANVTAYSDATAGAGDIDYYVVAMNGCGSAAASATVTGSRLPATPEVTGIVASDSRCDSVLITWTDIAGEDSFAVRRDGELIGTVAADVTQFGYLPADSNVAHTYTVVGYNNCGLGLISAGDAGTRLGRPSQVLGVTASEDNCETVTVTWTALALADSFVVLRNDVRVGMALGSATTFTDATGDAGTVYNYTVQAYSVCGAGQVSAADAGNRLIAPVLPQNLTASVTHCDRVSLSWTASTGDVDQYKIYRDGTILVATVAGDQTTYNDTAAPDGPSIYTVTAVSEQCGETVPSTPAVGERLVVPAQPQDVTASIDLCTGVHLTWGVTTGDVDSFRVYQDGIHIASVLTGVLAYDAVPGAPGDYQYRIAGYSNDCAVEGPQSAAVTGTMLAQPTAVSGVQVSTTRCDAILLSWTVGTGAVTGYIVVRDGVELDTTTAIADSYADNSATVGAHSYVIRTYSAICTEPTPPVAVVGVKQAAPTAPTNVAATTTECDSVIVTWTAATGTFDTYRLFRDGVLWATIPGTETSYGEITTSGVDYRYTVTAFDDVCGETDSTAGATGRRISDVGVPQNVTATGVCPGVTVAWDAASGIPVGYRIYRNGTLLRDVAAPATSFTDSTADYGTEYTYKVLAYSTVCGETAFSNEAAATRIPLPTQVVGLSASTANCFGVMLQWDAMDGAAQYKIYRDGTVLDSVAAGTTSYTDTTIAPRASHSYTVGAQNACDVGALSVAAVGTRADVPDVVTALAASDTSCAAVHLNWTDVATETDYVILRDDVAIDTVSADVVSFVDATATPGDHTYQLIALNTCGASAATAAVSGTRIVPVTAVTTVTTTDDLCTGIELTWTDLPNETGYAIYRDGVLAGEVAGDVLTYLDATATAGSHDYEVAGSNVCGIGPRSTIVAGSRFAAPPQVTAAAATQDSCSSVTLTWTDIATEDKYYIYRGGVLIDSVLADVTTFRDDTLVPGAYVYTVTALNYCGLGLASADINGRVADVPGLVTNMAATGEFCDSVVVTWTDLPDEAWYEIFRDGNSLGFLTNNTTRFVDVPDSGRVVNYQIKGINACGVGTLNAPAFGFRLKLPEQVLNVVAVDTACGALTVQWTNVQSAAGYFLYRDGTLVATQTDTLAGSATDPNPPAGTYQYTVQAYNACGNGPLSVAEAGTRLPAMAAVVLSAASTTYCDSITVTWADLTGELGYRVLRDDVQIAELAADVTHYNDAAAEVGDHTYTIVAFNFCGAGPVSNVLTGTRLGAPPVVTNVVASDNSCTNVVITWTDVAGETGYRVYRDDTFVGSTAADVATFTDIPGTGTYLYAVRSFNSCDTALAVTDNGSQVTTPDQVTGVTASTTRCDSVIISWTDLASDSAYQILRGNVLIGSALQNAVRFADAPAAGTYQYAVRAINRCGTGVNSTEVTGTRVQTPSAPASIAVTDSCGMVGIRWGAATGAVNSYYIYRGTNVVQVVSADTTDRYWIDHVTAGTYAYSVRAHSNLCGDGPATAGANGTSFAPPSVPTNMQIAPAMCDSVRLTWTASTGTVVGYIVRRDLVNIDTVTALRFVDLGVNDARSHAYSVAAYNNACGASAFTTVAFGHLRPLLEITVDLPDTLRAGQQYRVDYSRCGGAVVDSLFLSIGGGAYSFLDILSSTQNFDSVMIPMVTENRPNSRFRVISARGTRRDTLTSDALVITPPSASILAHENLIPKEFFLDQNYPNPFNPLTNIRFGVPRAAEVKVVIYDLMGREIETIVNGTMQPGIHTVTWDCSHCPSGMYMLRLESPDRVQMRKMLLMK